MDTFLLPSNDTEMLRQITEDLLSQYTHSEDPTSHTGDTADQFFYPAQNTDYSTMLENSSSYWSNNGMDAGAYDELFHSEYHRSLDDAADAVLSNDDGYLEMSYEAGTPQGPPEFNKMAMIKTIVLSVMFVISLIGNTATLIQMFRMRRRKSTINTLIMHLATADLFVTFFCNVTDAVWASTVQWYAGTLMCKVLKFLQVFGLYLSTYIIVIIAVDRCMAILDPMSRNKAPQRVRNMIILAWLLSAFFSLPQVISFCHYYILFGFIWYMRS